MGSSDRAPAPGVSEWRSFGILPQPSGTGQFGAIQSVARSFGVELSPINVRDPPEIERGITAFARSANDGLIVTGA